jgi:translation initiation factor IF-1
MTGRDQIEATGTVVEVLARDAYRVELANGHRCIARAKAGTQHVLGAAVRLGFSPADLSRARILL